MQAAKGIAILGSTGEVGRRALEVLERFPEMFDLQVISANENTGLLIEQAKKFEPNIVVCNDEHYQDVSDALYEEDIHIYAGDDALKQVVTGNEIHTVLSAISGIQALEPTIQAITAGKTIALANKETLTVAGEFMTSLVLKHGARIIPVDASLSGIFQCLAGEYQNGIERVYLTAKGSNDQTSLINTCWKIMEARWLFGLRPDQVDLLIHPQAVIESLVQFDDGCMKTNWVAEDKNASLQYAITYPHRIQTSGPRFNFLSQPNLQFERPKLSDLPFAQLIYDVMDAGGTLPCALYAANEVTSKKFAQGSISFEKLLKINEEVMRKMHSKGVPELDEILDVYHEAHKLADKLCG